jgi:ATP synthase protein I
MASDHKKHRHWAEHVAVVSQIGLTLAGCIVFCFFIGRALDHWLGTKGIFITIFILLGIAGGANVVYRQIMRVTEQDRKNKEFPDDE